tara:strand:- start:37678 stop:38661 length:984 start_codon:yes stop_codon:yes gene_type:complete
MGDYCSLLAFINQMNSIGIMHEFDISSLDIRTLKTLKLVHDLGSFSRAAEQLGQNQSTVSYAIDRLRTAFNDPLFVRQGRGVSPTLRCTELVARVEMILDQIAAMVEPTAFDASQARTDITLSCNHYERAVVLPSILRRLRKDAPGIRLKIMPSGVDGHRQLHRGACDLLLSPVLQGSERLFRRLLLEDRYVCVVHADHPLCGKTMSPADYGAVQHVLISYQGGWSPGHRQAAEAEGISTDVIIDLPSTSEVGRLIEGTDLVATIPLLLANTLGDSIVILESPFTGNLPVYQYWTTRTNLSPTHRWLRDMIAEEARRVTQGHGPGTR